MLHTSCLLLQLLFADELVVSLGKSHVRISFLVSHPLAIVLETLQKGDHSKVRKTIDASLRKHLTVFSAKGTAVSESLVRKVA